MNEDDNDSGEDFTNDDKDDKEDEDGEDDDLSNVSYIVDEDEDIKNFNGA